MKITVKLYAMLQDKLPQGTKKNSVELDLPEGSTATVVIEHFKIPKEMAHLVMVNGKHLLPNEVRERPLKEGEVLAMFPPIMGGR